jgi:hypothetical protein
VIEHNLNVEPRLIASLKPYARNPRTPLRPELELDFEVTVTGFETAEIDLLIGELDLGQTVDQADEVPR